MMVENKRDTQIANSLISDTKTTKKQQRTFIRSMSLSQTAHDPCTVNETEQVEAEATVTLKGVGVAGLITQPTQ